MHAACTQLANLLAHSLNDLCKEVEALLPREEPSKLLTCPTTRTDRLNLQHTGKQHHQLPAAHSRPYPRHAGRRTNRHSLIYTHTSTSTSTILILIHSHSLVTHPTRLLTLEMPRAHTHRTHPSNPLTPQPPPLSSPHQSPRQSFTLTHLPLIPLAYSLSKSLELATTKTHTYQSHSLIYPHSAHRTQSLAQRNAGSCTSNCEVSSGASE